MRATSPVSSATTQPAISPPAVMAKRLRPANIKPIAAPGRIACAMASPTRLIRRSIRNTPSGPAPSASAVVPASARRMNSNSKKGAIRALYMNMLRRRLRRRTFIGLFIERFTHPPRPQQIFRRQDLLGFAPGYRFAREQQCLGKIVAHEVDVVQRGQDGALLAVPALHEFEEVG